MKFTKYALAFVVAAVVIATPVPSFAGSSLGVADIGTPFRVQNFLGPGGLINHIEVSFYSVGDHSEVTFLCRRPNLGPCVGLAGSSACYQFVATLSPVCYFSYNTVCGEAVISYVQQLGPLPCGG